MKVQCAYLFFFVLVLWIKIISEGRKWRVFCIFSNHNAMFSLCVLSLTNGTLKWKKGWNRCMCIHSHQRMKITYENKISRRLYLHTKNHILNYIPTQFKCMKKKSKFVYGCKLCKYNVIKYKEHVLCDSLCGKNKNKCKNERILI